MKKVLLLFCFNFASTGDGDFILPELKYWIRAVDRIIIFAARKAEDCVDLPSPDIEFLYLNLPKGWKAPFRSFLFYGFLLLFQKRFWRELLDIVSIAPSLSNIYCAVSKYAYQKQAEKKVIQYLTQHPIAANDEVILYSFWLDYIAGLAAEIHVSGKVLKRIARAHGYDLYDDQPGNGYMPWRRDRLDKLDHVYTASDAGAKFLKMRFPDMRNKVSRAYLGSEDFGFQEYTPSKMLRLISCSWLVPVKRVEKIIEALSQIKDISIKWTHIGAGPEEVKLKLLAEKILSSNIQCDWRGFLPHEQVKQVYRTECFDLFVSTSVSEGLPVSMLESLSCGIPIIATAVGGVPEIVRPEKSGWLLSPDAPEQDFYKVVSKYLVMTLPERIRLRTSCRKLWGSDFTPEINHTGSLNHICSMLKEKTGAEI